MLNSDLTIGSHRDLCLILYNALGPDAVAGTRSFLFLWFLLLLRLKHTIMSVVGVDWMPVTKHTNDDVVVVVVVAVLVYSASKQQLQCYIKCQLQWFVG